MNPTWPGWLSDLMQEKKLNNKGLAFLLVVSPSTVGDWIKGKYKPDSLSIIKLAELANWSAPKLFAIVHDLPWPNETDADLAAKSPRTFRQIVEVMPTDQLERLLVMVVEKLHGKNGEGA